MRRSVIGSWVVASSLAWVVSVASGCGAATVESDAEESSSEALTSRAWIAANAPIGSAAERDLLALLNDSATTASMYSTECRFARNVAQNLVAARQVEPFATLSAADRVYGTGPAFWAAAAACARNRSADAGSAAASDPGRFVVRRYPSGAVHSSFGYFDSVRGRVVAMTGGWIRENQPAVWSASEWDGAAWTPPRMLDAGGAGPLPGQDAGLSVAFDQARGELICFTLGETWVLRGNAWAKKTPVHAPSYRWQPTLAYDPSLGRVVLFGGADSKLIEEPWPSPSHYETTNFDDTWTWTGSDWEQKIGPGPRGRWSASMVYDPVRQGWCFMVEVAGTGDYSYDLPDTWLLRATGWVELAQDSLGTAKCSAPTLFFDPKSSLVTRVCGTLPATFDGVTWTPIPYRGTWDPLRAMSVYQPNTASLVTWEDQRTLVLTRTVAPNQAPVFEGAVTVGDRSVYAGDPLNILLQAADPEGDRVAFQVAPMPAGATLVGAGASTRWFGWKPTMDQIGTHDVVFEASDGDAATSRAARLTVAEPVYTNWFARGTVASKQTRGMWLSIEQRVTGRDGGAAGVPGGAFATLTCSLGGTNPLGLTVTCNVQGQHFDARDGSTLYGAEGTSAPVSGGGGFSIVSRGERPSFNVGGVITRSGGQVAITVDHFAYSKTFLWSGGWPGTVFLNMLPGASVTEVLR